MPVSTDSLPSPFPEQPVAAEAGRGVSIGVFDSGLGGLSVLRAIRAHLPAAELLYVADSGHAPYGEKSDEFIGERSEHISRFLMTQGADLIVVACNTATAAAVHHLRSTWPSMPVVGVEPGVKPAVAHSRNQRIGVLATPFTLQSEKFRSLLERHGGNAHIVLQPCPGLAREIERGLLDSPELHALVSEFSQPLIDAGVDTAVLGCTHYPFVAPLFQQALGDGVHIIDTAEAVARQTARRVLDLPIRRDAQARAAEARATRLWSSGDPALLTHVAHAWLGLKTQAGALPKE
ncbi:MAG TPA: glutamate racemase [Candidatus Aquabacterium excrementipullorum]|nr:glutamate racemase [Candidatus Aquabacterium excrementipullorum]